MACFLLRIRHKVVFLTLVNGQEAGLLRRHDVRDVGRGFEIGVVHAVTFLRYRGLQRSAAVPAILMQLLLRGVFQHVYLFIRQILQVLSKQGLVLRDLLGHSLEVDRFLLFKALVLAGDLRLSLLIHEVLMRHYDAAVALRLSQNAVVVIPVHHVDAVEDHGLALAASCVQSNHLVQVLARPARLARAHEIVQH